MKKKTLLLTLLALAIVTSITAGTLAVYTKSVDLTNQAVVIKKFAFAAAGKLEGEATAINLAPKEKQDYLFEVTNYETSPEGVESSFSEVPLTIKVSIDFSDAVAKMPGLIAELKQDGVSVASTTNGIIIHTTNMANTAKLKSAFVLTLTWADSSDVLQSEAGKLKKATNGLRVNVTATQKTGS